MATINDLITEIETISDDMMRADKYISSAAIRCNLDDGDSSRALLEYALTIITQMQSSPDVDRLISQLAYQYACAWHITRVQDVLILIADKSIVNDTRAIVSAKIAEYDLTTALSIINDMTIDKDKALSDVAIVQASIGNITEAYQVRDSIPDTNTRINTKYRIIDKIARGLNTA